MRFKAADSNSQRLVANRPRYVSSVNRCCQSIGPRILRLLDGCRRDHRYMTMQRISVRNHDDWSHFPKFWQFGICRQTTPIDLANTRRTDDPRANARRWIQIIVPRDSFGNRCYCAVMLPSFTTRPHFTISFSMYLANSPRLMVTVVAPSRANTSRSSGAFSASCVAS